VRAGKLVAITVEEHGIKKEQGKDLQSN